MESSAELTTCGLISVIGQANAGKSTLINALVGQKVSIVSAKAHTTRYGIYGIICKEKAQIILMDTPGFIRNPKGKLQNFMHNVTKSSFKADAFLWVIDASIPFVGNMDELVKLMHSKPFAIVLNKVDKVSKPKLLQMAQNYKAYTESIFMISAKSQSGLEAVFDYAVNHLKPGPWLFPEQDLTQISERFWAEEVTREKVFTNVHQEIPYQAHVITEQWHETNKQLTIRQCILAGKDGHRKLVLGHKGCRIRTIGIQARREMEIYFQKSVHLFLYVKISPDWICDL